MGIFRKLSWKKSLAVKISLKRDTKYHQQSATCLDTNLLCSPVNLDTNQFFLFSFCSIKTDSLMLPISGDESPKERVKWLDGNQVGHFLFYYNPLWYMFGDIFCYINSSFVYVWGPAIVWTLECIFCLWLITTTTLEVFWLLRKIWNVLIGKLQDREKKH